jgi:hypothetical protein
MLSKHGFSYHSRLLFIFSSFIVDDRLSEGASLVLFLWQKDKAEKEESTHRWIPFLDECDECVCEYVSECVRVFVYMCMCVCVYVGRYEQV